MAQFSAIWCALVLLGGMPVAMAEDQSALVLNESDDIIVMSVTPRDPDVKPRMASISDMRNEAQPATAAAVSGSSDVAPYREFLAGARATN